MTTALQDDSPLISDLTSQLARLRVVSAPRQSPASTRLPLQSHPPPTSRFATRTNIRYVCVKGHKGEVNMSTPSLAEDHISHEALLQHAQNALTLTHRDLIGTRCLLVGTVYAGLAVFNWFVMPPTIAVVTTVMAAVTALLFAALAWFHRGVEYPLNLLNPLAVMELVILQVDALAFTWLTQDVMNSLGLYVMIMSTGIFLASTAWIAACVLGLVTSWTLLLALAGLPFDPLAHGAGLTASLLLCPFFYLLRKRAQQRLSSHEIREDRYRSELEAALARIDVLTGLLPICAGCKQIRDKDGAWSQVEDYIERHSDIRFTHSLCDQCMQAYYPEIAEP